MTFINTESESINTCPHVYIYQFFNFLATEELLSLYKKGWSASGKILAMAGPLGGSIDW